jgi:hypothetical protein
MIVFDLECRAGGHRFEGWFGSSAEFERQREGGLLACPVCGGADVGKAVMAPAVPRKGNQLPEPPRPAPAKEAVASGGPAVPPKVAAMLQAYARAQAEALKTSTWVGEHFPEQARAMHYGEKDTAAIHGQASAQEVRDLVEEGVPIAPVLFPVVPPEQAN